MNNNNKPIIIVLLVLVIGLGAWLLFGKKKEQAPAPYVPQQQQPQQPANSWGNIGAAIGGAIGAAIAGGGKGKDNVPQTPSNNHAINGPINPYGKFTQP